MAIGDQQHAMAAPTLTLVRPLAGWRPAVAMAGRTLVFLHVPKAAGTTLDHILHHLAAATGRRCLRLRGWYLAAGEPEARAAFDACPPGDLAGLDMLTGHLPFGVQHRLPQPAVCATLLRDPVARLRSHDRFGLATGRWTPDTPIEALITAGRLPADIQTRQMAGVTDPARPADAATLATALTHLDTAIDLVGTVAQFDRFLAVLLALFDGPAVVYGRFQRIAGPTDLAREATVAPAVARHFAHDRRLVEAAAEAAAARPWRHGLLRPAPDDGPPRDLLLVSPDLALGGRPATLVSAAHADRFLAALAARGVTIRDAATTAA